MYRKVLISVGEMVLGTVSGFVNLSRMSTITRLLLRLLVWDANSGFCVYISPETRTLMFQRIYRRIYTMAITFPSSMLLF